MGSDMSRRAFTPASLLIPVYRTWGLISSRPFLITGTFKQCNHLLSWQPINHIVQGPCYDGTAPACLDPVKEVLLIGGKFTHGGFYFHGQKFTVRGNQTQNVAYPWDPEPHKVIVKLGRT